MLRVFANNHTGYHLLSICYISGNGTFSHLTLNIEPSDKLYYSPHFLNEETYVLEDYIFFQGWQSSYLNLCFSDKRDQAFPHYIFIVPLISTHLPGSVCLICIPHQLQVHTYMCWSSDTRRQMIEKAHGLLFSCNHERSSHGAFTLCLTILLVLGQWEF